MTAFTGLPFDDIRAVIGGMPGPDEIAIGMVRHRDRHLTKPPGSLGRLEAIAEWLAAWQRRGTPSVGRVMVAIFAANHGVAARGVSAYPPAVTEQMVANFAAGGAAINQICTTFDFGLKVFDLALDVPTPDVTEDDAFDEPGCAATIAFGMESIAGGADLLVVGEMGIANTTVAACIYHALYGGSAGDWTGLGTGVDPAGLSRKTAAVAAAVERIGGVRDPLEILRRIGGREIAAMLGAIVAARHERIPVVVDGYVATAAAALLHAIDPRTIDHVLIGHRSAEAAHGEVLRRIGKEPVLDLGMRLGEGTGAALAAAVVRAAAATHTGMATFEQAGVSNRA